MLHMENKLSSVYTVRLIHYKDKQLPISRGVSGVGAQSGKILCPPVIP
jgi:hypothetical protein